MVNGRWRASAFLFVMGGVTCGKLELSLSAAHEFRLSSRGGCACVYASLFRVYSAGEVYSRAYSYIVRSMEYEEWL